MNKVAVVLCTFMICLAPLPALAGSAVLGTTIDKAPSCDRRTPRVDVDLPTDVGQVGYRAASSDIVTWLESDGVSAGTHRYTLPRQRYGSTKEWVMVADQEGGDRAESSTLTFVRPERDGCVHKFRFGIPRYLKGINEDCFEGSRTEYYVHIKVSAGTPGYVVGAGRARLTQVNGVRLISNKTGDVISPQARRVNYYVRAARTSTLKLGRDYNTVTVVTSSKEVHLTGAVTRTCYGTD